MAFKSSGILQLEAGCQRTQQASENETMKTVDRLLAVLPSANEGTSISNGDERISISLHLTTLGGGVDGCRLCQFFILFPETLSSLLV